MNTCYYICFQGDFTSLMADKDIFICESDNTLYGIPQNINTIPKFLKTYC